MEYRKERNLFIATEGEKVKGKYDSNTGIYYGVKGAPIKTMPSAFKDTIYANIFTSHQWIITHTTDETLRLALGRWEQLASLGLYTDNHNILVDKNYDFPALKKDLVKYIKDNNNCCYDSFTQKMYDIQKAYPEFNLLNNIFVGIVKNILFGAEYSFPLGWGISAMLRLQLEDAYYLYTTYELARHLSNYYSHCMAMDQKPAITKNFMITIAHTEHLYENYKAEKMNDWLKKYNDIPQLYYENDTYIVRPLLSRDDFHAEAEAQSNCVERLYMEKVANGRTHVVTVRKKNTPDVSLITCEISNDMRIIQYYAKYNNTPNRAEAQFKQELALYLASLSLSQE
jgi:hypothetical protein